MYVTKSKRAILNDSRDRSLWDVVKQEKYKRFVKEGPHPFTCGGGFPLKLNWRLVALFTKNGHLGVSSFINRGHKGIRHRRGFITSRIVLSKKGRTVAIDVGIWTWGCMVKASALLQCRSNWRLQAGFPKGQRSFSRLQGYFHTALQKRIF